MSVNMEAFQQFGGAVQGLAEKPPAFQLTEEEQVKRARDLFFSRIDAGIAMDLESCIHCGMCAYACHFYSATRDPKYAPVEKYKLLRRFYRRELSPYRWFYKLFTSDITAKNLREWEELVYDSCTECGRCALICPIGINIPRMVQIMRQGLAEAGIVPIELQALSEEQKNQQSLFGVGKEQLQGIVQKLKSEGVEIPLDQDRAEVMVLTSVADIAVFNDSLAATAKIMKHLGKSWNISSDAFECANFGLLSGDEKVQRLATQRIVDAAVKCGANAVITSECGHSYAALRWEGANEYGKPLPFEVLYLSEFLGREVNAGRLKIKPIGKDKKVTFHDPCKVGRQGGCMQEPRDVLKALGVDFRETPSHKETNWCCGGGAGVFVINRAAPLRQQAFEIKARQVDESGADSVITSCASCRLNFMVGGMNLNWNKQTESLVELVGENLAG